MKLQEMEVKVEEKVEEKIEKKSELTGEITATSDEESPETIKPDGPATDINQVNEINISDFSFPGGEMLETTDRLEITETTAPPEKWSDGWKEAVFQAGIIILIMFLVLWPVRVEGISMEPNFRNKDMAFMSRLMVMLNIIDYGEVVVFRLDESRNPNGEYLIKRVIGMPGDLVEINGGDIYINDTLLDENYLELEEDIYGMSNDSYTELGADEYFVLGDNRDRSMDSRSFGSVTKKELVGKVYFRFLPLSDMRFY